MIRKIFLTVVMALGLSTWGGDADATLVRAMNLTELAVDANTIVKVKVIGREMAMDPEESGTVVTYYTFQVLDWIKGTPTSDNELVIKQIGQGEYTVGGHHVRQNLYFPEYQLGKTYVLFLPEAHEKTGLLAPLGLQQGVFPVVEQDGQEILPQLKARQKLLQTRLPEDNKGKFLKLKLDSATTDPSYENFKTMIQAAGE